MTTKKLIRAEIERRIRELDEQIVDIYDSKAVLRKDELQRLLVFLDTLTEEPVSDDLEEAAERYAIPFNDTTYGVEYSFKGFKAGAEWGEKNAYKAIMKKADEVRDKRFDTDYEVRIEPAAGFDLGCVNVYHEGKLVGQYVEPKEEEKLPEGVEEAAEKSSTQYYKDAGYSPFPNVENAAYKSGFIAGAEWMKEQEQPVPTIMTNEMLMGEIEPKKKSNAIFDKCVENCDPAVMKEVSDNVDKMLFEEAAEDSWSVYEYRESPKGLYSSCYIDGFIAGAEWHSKKEQDTIKTAEDHAFLAGADWQKEQMVKNAVEGEVVKDISNKLAVTAKNINLDGFKFGDKVRVFIVKEEEE